MKKFNKTSKFFILISVIIALSVMCSVVAFATNANNLKNDAAAQASFYEYAWNIKVVNFADSLADIESSADSIIKTWDVSVADDSVKAWIKPYVDDAFIPEEEVKPENVRYELYIGANGKIKAPENMKSFFEGFANLTEVNGLQNLDTSAVTTMESMFEGCTSLEKLDLADLDTKNVADMSYMFKDCKALKDVVFQKFNEDKTEYKYFSTENVKFMHFMFAECKSLVKLDLFSFDTKNVLDVQSMFANCENLRTIEVSNDWSFDKVNSGEDMFRNCYCLKSNMTYDPVKVSVEFATPKYYTTDKSIYKQINISLYVGETKSLSAFVDENTLAAIKAYNIIENASLISIANGNVTGKAKGFAKVKAELNDGVKGAITIIVNVKEPEQTNVEVPSGLLDGFLGEVLGAIMSWFDSIKRILLSLLPFDLAI